MASNKPIFLFGPYVLDTGMHALFNGAEEIGLKPLPLDVLITLVENAPHMVTRDALLDKHWKDIEVTPNALDQAIGTLRKKFRAQPDGDEYIQTIKKKGYRFAKPVERKVGSTDTGKTTTTPVGEAPSPNRVTVKDIHGLLTKATTSGTTRLVTWREGDDLRDDLELSSSVEKERVTLRPDAFFTLEDTTRPEGHNRVHFFLNADRQTPEDQFEKTILAYWKYQTSGKYTARYGLRPFRLVTFCSSDERTAQLVKLAHNRLPEAAQRRFLFTALPTASVNILGDVFIRSLDFGTDARCGLVPARKNQQSANV